MINSQQIQNVILVGRSTNTVYKAKTNTMIMNRKIEVELFCPMNLNKYLFHANIVCSIIMKSESLRFVLKSMKPLNIYQRIIIYHGQ